MLSQHRNPVLKKILDRRKTINTLSDRINKVRPPRPNARVSEFVPVQLSCSKQSDINETTPDQKIEILFPDGIRVILSGGYSLSAARAILSTTL